MSTVSRDVVIVNPQGLHARPAMMFAETANQFKAAVRVARSAFADDIAEVDGKSLIQMISLEASAGATLRIRAEGEDADAAVAELARLVQNGFGEE
jgi:phosphotransferase system HPr (HPr) family protein